MDEYHATKAANGHQILTYDECCTMLVWELLMIAVEAPRHRQGIGSLMMRAVEDAVKALNGRLLLSETSDKSSFERTRQFYRKHGSSEVARIPDYSSDGDGKGVVYQASLTIGFCPEHP